MLLVAFVVTMVFCGGLGVTIERLCLRPLRNVKGPAAMITTIGVSYILFNVILLTVGADSKNFPNPMPSIRYQIGGAVLDFRVMLIWVDRAAADGGAVHVRAALAHRQGDAGDGAGRRSRAHDGRRGGSASSSWRSSSAPRWPAPAG